VRRATRSRHTSQIGRSRSSVRLRSWRRAFVAALNARRASALALVQSRIGVTHDRLLDGASPERHVEQGTSIPLVDCPFVFDFGDEVEDDGDEEIDERVDLHITKEAVDNVMSWFSETQFS